MATFSRRLERYARRGPSALLPPSSAPFYADRCRSPRSPYGGSLPTGDCAGDSLPSAAAHLGPRMAARCLRETVRASLCLALPLTSVPVRRLAAYRRSNSRSPAQASRVSTLTISSVEEKKQKTTKSPSRFRTPYAALRLWETMRTGVRPRRMHLRGATSRQQRHTSAHASP